MNEPAAEIDLTQCESIEENQQSIKKYEAIFEDIVPWSGNVPSGYVANFLGVLRSQDFLIGNERELYAYAENGAYDVRMHHPEVCDGEEFFEWIDVLAAVRSARNSFTMIELGAGYAARSVNANAALDYCNPVPRKFVVVEGERQHFAWAQEHFKFNGADPNGHWFVPALVNATGMPELFVHAAGRYCNMIVNDKAIEEILGNIDRLNLSHSILGNLLRHADIGTEFTIDDDFYGKVPLQIGFISAVTLNTLLQPLDFVDYLDVDIQYAEHAVIPASIDMIEDRVKRVHIGTHSRDIHVELRALLQDRGWRQVFDFLPLAEHATLWGNFTTSDGILTAVNPKFDDGS